MIHYTCDMCGQPMCPDELRYVVEIQIYPTFDPAPEQSVEADADHLEELNDVLEELHDADEPELLEGDCQQMRVDLCPACRRKYAKDPLHREPANSNHMGFSDN